MTKSNTHYHSVAIILHWVMAAAFIIMLVSGIAMTDYITDKSLQYRMYQWHKSGGVLLLFAIVARIVVRLLTTPPALPAVMNARDALLAKTGHMALYVLMLLMPLTGWCMVSASPYGLPTIVFDWFTWPDIAVIAYNERVHALANIMHEYSAYVLIAMIVAHIGAVVKHYVYDAINVLPRMWWSKM